MLTPGEEDFLRKIPQDKKATIKPYDATMHKVAITIIQEIHVLFPEVDVKFLGASALGISGLGDIDIYILSPKEKFKKYLSALEILFGNKVAGITSIEWQFEKEGFPITVYLTDPSTETMRRQLAVFHLLKENNTLLLEYEVLKQQMDGKLLKEYQRVKYEFYHKILGENS